MDKILVVEDDDNLRLTLVDNLELEGYQVLSVASLADAKKSLKDQEVVLIILDIMLPDGSGYDFSQEIRANRANTMVLMLTARTLNSDLIMGFSSGADDYMTKPYKLNELLARVKALIARSHSFVAYANQVCSINGFNVNWRERTIIEQVSTDIVQSVHLTKKEFDLLYLLYINVNKPFSREEILKQVWGEDIYVEERTVDNFISVIRKALRLNESEEFFIRTVRGVGYSLVNNAIG